MTRHTNKGGKMAPKILVVDRNIAFATMLKEMLEQDGGYQVDMVHSGNRALARLSRGNYDLTIVDMDLDPHDMDSPTLIEQVRTLDPQMRLVLIPLMGENLPDEAEAWGIQGTLSKPFFADDLLPKIHEALTRPIVPPAQHAPAGRAVPTADLQSLLAELARETQAEAVFLFSKEPGQEGVVAHTSSLSGKQLDALAYMIFAAVQSAQALARFWGQPDRPFEHNMFENDDLRLYIMALPQNLQLVIITPLSTPLGTVRHNLRRSVRRLDALTLT